MTQRKVVITGAAGGIGIALVDEFRAHGWRVIGVDVSPPSTDAQIDEWVEGDLKDASTRTAIRHAVEDSADALVNNAALQINSPFRKMTETELFQSFETNLFASVLLTQEIAGALVDRRGAIVNVGTVHSVATSANVFPYSISKAALSGFTRSVAIEMAAEQVRCNSVLLGAVDTPMLRAGLSRRDHPDGADGNRRELIDRTPLQKIATPQEVAPAVRFFADSNLSSYVTGQCLLVDGGVSVKLASE